MFTVRGKSGKVVGQYATKAEAERRIAQLKAGAARLRPFQFAGGRTSRSPTPINLEVVPSQHGGYVLGYPDGTFWTPSGPLSWPPSSWTGPTSGRWYSLEGAQKALNNIRRGKEPEPDEPKVKRNAGHSPTREYREITQADVGKVLFPAFGRKWAVSEFIGRIMPQDVGKRVYKVAPDMVQVENNEQRARRTGSARSPGHERQGYTVFTRQLMPPRTVRVVQHDLTLSEARAMCARINADPNNQVYGEFTTNENFRASFPNARRLSRSQSPSTGTKQKIYRGFLIKISHGGTWCEGNIYKKDGSIAEHIGSGSCGPGASLKAATIGKMIERGERIIDAMQGD